MYRALYITHRIFKTEEAIKKGGSDYIFDYFNKKNNFIVIESNLTDFSVIKEDIIRISYQNFDTYENLYIHKSKNRGFFLKFFKEFFIINYFLLFKLKKFNFAIVVNPINVTYTLLPSFFKKINYKYFHIVDYSKNRFKNNFLNFIYRFLFKVSIKNCDKAGSVSKNIINEFALSDKLFHIPNSPSNRNYLPINFIDKKYDFILCIAEINHTINLDLIIDVIFNLKKKIEINCLITGNFIDKDFKKKILDKIFNLKLKNNFHFIGFVSMNDLDYYLNYSKIGIVAYNRQNLLDYYKYADSLKIREYAYFGLPILSDSVFPTAFEALDNQAGYIYEDYNEFYQFSYRLLTDLNLYSSVSINSKKWSDKNDKFKKLRHLEKCIG